MQQPKPRRHAARVLLAAMLVTGWLGPASAIAADGGAARFVAQLNATIARRGVGSPDPQAMARSICHDIAGSSIDLATMAKNASAGAIDQMNEGQREAFRAALLRRLLRDCVANARDFLAGPVTLAGSRQLGSGQMLIGTHIAGEAQVLMWQVRPSGPDRFLVTDLFVNGRSAVQALREQSALSLQHHPGDVAALIAALSR